MILESRAAHGRVSGVASGSRGWRSQPPENSALGRKGLVPYYGERPDKPAIGRVVDWAREHCIER